MGTTLKKSRIFFETRNPSKKIYYNISKTRNSEPYYTIKLTREELRAQYFPSGSIDEPYRESLRHKCCIIYNEILQEDYKNCPKHQMETQYNQYCKNCGKDMIHYAKSE